MVVAPAHAASHSRGAANSAAASLAGACCKRHPGTLFSVSQKTGRQTAHTSRSVQRRKALRSCVRRGPLVVVASKMRAGRPRGHTHNLLELAEPWRAVAMLYATCASLQGPFVRELQHTQSGQLKRVVTARFCTTCRAGTCPRSTRPPRPSACQPSAGGCSTGGCSRRRPKPSSVCEAHSLAR